MATCNTMLTRALLLISCDTLATCLAMFRKVEKCSTFFASCRQVGKKSVLHTQFYLQPVSNSSHQHCVTSCWEKMPRVTASKPLLLFLSLLLSLYLSTHMVYLEDCVTLASLKILMYIVLVLVLSLLSIYLSTHMLYLAHCTTLASLKI